MAETGKCDVLVCGGGMAGFGAACAAAAGGADTMLVERLAILGGLGSAGGVGNFCYGGGPPIGQGSVFDAIWKRLEDYGAIGEENGWPVERDARWQRENHIFDHAVLPIVLQEVAEEYGVRVLLNTDVIDCRVGGAGDVTQALLMNRSLHQRVTARVFIDGTGDGILSRLSGARALDLEPPGVIKPSLMVFLRRSPDAHRQNVPHAGYYNDGNAPDYSTWREPHGRIALKMKLFDHNFDTGSAEGCAAAEKAFRARIPEVVRHFQEHHDPQYVFDHAAAMLGTREGRRIQGDYVLTVDDVRTGRCFDDSVAFGAFSIDATDVDAVVPPYQIPYRSLLVRNLGNLLVVGRCFSADRLAMSSARIMATCCLMGQAAGIAGAHACHNSHSLRSVPPDAIRTALLEGAAHGDFLQEHICRTNS